MGGMQVATIVFLAISMALFIALVAVALLLGRVRGLRDADEGANRLRLAAQNAEQAVTRRLRLVAHDLRGIGMSLHGHADHFWATGHPHADAIATAAVDLLGIADDLQEQDVQTGIPRMLREEPIDVSEALADAIEATATSLGPGRRQWRLAPDIGGIVLRADRRALRHALTRVLAEAVRNTRQNDWIDISVQTRADEMVVMIADEGLGLAHPEAGAPATRDSRGIGLRLALARVLMEAHGGRLEIEARTGIGTRVSLIFPDAQRSGAARQATATPLRRESAPDAQRSGAARQATSDAQRSGAARQATATPLRRESAPDAQRSAAARQAAATPLASDSNALRVARTGRRESAF
jgi:signal transduction histidine kinase